MYLHIGENTMVRLKDVIGIFSLEENYGMENMSFLRVGKEEGFIRRINDEEPKSFVVTESDHRSVIYLSPISAKTLKKRSLIIDGNEGE